MAVGEAVLGLEPGQHLAVALEAGGAQPLGPAGDAERPVWASMLRAKVARAWSTLAMVGTPVALEREGLNANTGRREALRSPFRKAI